MQIPDIIARGAIVSTDQTCTMPYPPPADDTTTNTDGDAYTDLQEYSYVSLFYNEADPTDLARKRLKYMDYVFDGDRHPPTTNFMLLPSV